MRWVIVIAMLAAVSITGSLAFAAALDVNSANVTVDHNTLHSPVLNLTLSSPSITVGEAAYGSATLGDAYPSAGGTVRYAVYSDITCGAEYALAGTKTVINAVVPNSDSVTFTAAGTYYWRASYSGDGNHQPALSSCTAFTVNKTMPSMTTVASGPVTVGSGTITDTATLGGGYGMTGSVSFSVYAPGDTTCTTPLAPSSATVSGNGSYTSGAFTPTAAGAYRWIASYSGDANNNAVTGSCNDANESSTVNRAMPTMTTSASGPVTVGDAITDTAILGGGYGTLTGSISFSVYGPNNLDCTALLALSSALVSGANVYSSDAFTPAAAGTYRWIASYSGDPNNIAVTGSCNDVGESSIVTAP